MLQFLIPHFLLIDAEGLGSTSGTRINTGGRFWPPSRSMSAGLARPNYLAGTMSTGNGMFFIILACIFIIFLQLNCPTAI